MMEVACAVCGAVYRFAPADVPPGGKTVTCAKCKARIVVAGTAAGGTGDKIDLADLPAPKRIPAPPPRPGAPPAKAPAMDGIDLPPPKNRVPDALSTADLGLDLPAPKGPSQTREPEPLTLDNIDLLAPVGPTSSRNQGPPSVGAPIDLGLDSLDDLLAPKRPSGGEVPNLPASKRASDLPDLPAPKRASGLELPDLPAPKRASDLPDLPAPKRASGGDLFDDLPAPKGPSLADMLPAPKGPTPSAGQQIAPKGFFDDLPQAKGPSATGAGAKGPSATGAGAKGPGATAALPPNLPAPKGFFDDLPQAKGASTSGTDVAPKGFFDDLPAPRGAGAPPPPIPEPARPGALDLDGLDLASPLDAPAIELEHAVDSARQYVAPTPTPPPRSAGVGTSPPPLELGDVDALDGLDLPSPQAPAPGSTRAGGGVVSFKSGGGDEAPIETMRPTGSSDPSSLDLAGPAGPPRREEPKKAPVRAPAVDKKLDKQAALSPKVVKILAAIALLLGAAGAGGYFLYSRHQAAEQRAADIDRGLRTAREALLAGDKQHWNRALSAARGVLAKDRKHPEASGLVAQALLAAYLDDGAAREQRVRDARAALEPVRGAAGGIASIDKAVALDALIDGEAETAAKRLEALVARRDLDAILYLGWAQLALGAWDDAIKTFDRALKETPKRPVPALFGLARAQLGKGDRAAARATFLKVIEADKDHIGALVGEAEAMPPGDFVQREAALLAILQRKDIDTTDPRVIARAWTLAGDDARRAGRLDAARERYRKALALVPTDVPTLVSTAALELRDGKPDAAIETVDKALALAPDDVGANLVAAELDIKRNRLPEASTRLAALRDRTPPLAGPELGRLHLLDGMRLEATGQFDQALGSYEAATRALGEGEVAPVIASGKLLGEMAVRADADKQPAEAQALRARADEKLGKLATAAEKDPSVAITLGVAYLSAGVPVQSEAWLRKALARRPRDVEAHFQLAEALRRQGKQDEAIATLVKAFELDPSRIDLGVELARGFEAGGRDADAAALYKRLLDARDVSIDVRVRAGRFFARIKDSESARKQGEAILAVDPDNAAGLFLKGESLLADGHPAEARKFFQQAVAADLDPQYEDAVGRAAEAEWLLTGDTSRRDEALMAYGGASERAPTMLNPLLGRGRLHLSRNEYAKALVAYQAALAIAPGDPAIPYGIGLSYAEQRDEANAIKWLQVAVKAQPNGHAYFLLGQLYYDGNQAGPAAAAWTRATELGLAQERKDGKTVEWLTDAYWKLGSVEAIRGNDGATKRALESFIARNPTDKFREGEARRLLLGLR